jgi:hypothetical protein
MKEIKPVFFFHIDLVNSHRYVVYTVKSWDYHYYDPNWTCDPLLTEGGDCLVPDIDLVDESFVFNNEQEAMRKMAELYSAQLKE